MSFSALWTYQAERFPLAKTVPILTVFSAASICVSAKLADRPLPSFGAFVSGVIIALLIFFQMRVCDEYKDLDDDRRFRPERPIPRGLISLRLIISLGIGSIPITALAAFLWHPPVLWLLVLVWLWLAIMTAEFGAPVWLKARPVLYLASHMAIMPLIDLLLTGLEWIQGGGADRWLALFLVLSFVNGCVLEIGRKLWATSSEIVGVDSYSSLWGPRRAATVWIACLLVSYLLLLAVGFATGAFWISLVLGAVGVAVCLRAATACIESQTVEAEKRLDTFAGLWVFACYAIAGFAPLLQEIL